MSTKGVNWTGSWSSGRGRSRNTGASATPSGEAGLEPVLASRGGFLKGWVLNDLGGREERADSPNCVLAFSFES